MADGYYIVTGQTQQATSAPPVRSEIYLNKHFIQQPEPWFPRNGVIFRTKGNPEMYNNANQYPPGYDTSYQYAQNYGASYGYQGYGYQPAPPGEAYPQNSWTQPPPNYSALAQQSVQQTPPPKEEIKSEAVVQEIQQQKATLTKQREDYVKKAMVLRRELEQLKLQKQELTGMDRSEKELRSVLKDNEKLQEEINSKLKAILNVIEMLSTIIKDGKKFGDLEMELNQPAMTPSPKRESKEESRQRSRSPSKDADSRSERDARFEKDSRSERESRSEKDGGGKGDRDDVKRFNYVYYDTGLHWCRSCDKFPETAKEFLQHLHSSQHQEQAKENEVDTTPWHKLPTEPLLPSHDDAPKKRIPIKGLQFFISAPSWYCKLCDIWIGDLHCASHHLKSQAHFHNYENFVEQNPHWETEWIKDRERAMTRNGKHESSDSDDDRKKKKRKHRASIEKVLKDKKKKKRSKKKKKASSESSSSSSSSSESSSDEESPDKGKSIRVAMRNMAQVKSIINEDMSKWTVLEKIFEDARRKEDEKRELAKVATTEDEMINQWMTVSKPEVDKERVMLDSLKDRMRVKQDMEKAKMAEMERRRREKEREELELLERKRRQAREEAERAEYERKRQEQEEYNKILDKDRSHVRFRAARENFRKRRSSSDEEEDRRHERSRERSRDISRSRDTSPPPRSRKDSDRNSRKSPTPEPKEEPVKKKPPGPPSYKKLPFIGRMPLFKKKMEQKAQEKQEILKEEYEPSRKTRFETGNLTKAFIPKPELVHFPVLSSIPPISAPPAPTAVEKVAPPPPPVVQGPMPPPPRAPVPPKISKAPSPKIQQQHEESTYLQERPHEAATTYYNNYNNMMYHSHNYEYQNDALPHPPLEPPPLPPDDDLAMLGICADDMAAQSF